MPAINPHILTWARESAGLSLEEAAHRIGLAEARGISPTDRLAAIEAGDVPLTRPLLLKMSKQYRRPLLTFYLREPPTRGDRGEDFRTIPDRDRSSDALVDALVRDVRARQGLVKAILEDDEDVRPLRFVGSARMAQGVEVVSQAIRREIDLDLAEYRAQRTPEAAFALLREAVEKVGIFVLLAGNLGSHHTNLNVESFRGFALADEIAPFIVINDQDARPAWSFTLLHEVAHLWLGATGISGGFPDSATERFCNDVAGSLLLPAAELAQLRLHHEGDLAIAAREISDFAQERHLSRSMVAYRLFGQGQLSRPEWQALATSFRLQWQRARAAQRERQREAEGGPNYYIVRRHKVGPALLKFAARSLNSGFLTPTKAGKVLGVKPRSVAPLLSGAAL